MTKFVSRHSGQVQKMIEEAYQKGRTDGVDEYIAKTNELLEYYRHYKYAEVPTCNIEQELFDLVSAFGWLKEQK